MKTIINIAPVRAFAHWLTAAPAVAEKILSIKSDPSNWPTAASDIREELIMRRLHNACVGLVFVAMGGLTLSPVLADDSFSPYVDDEGTISFPEGFRTSMAHLGSWFVPEGDASGFHDVYAEKETVEAFRKTGKFPDGATLVKELRASNAGNYTTGTGVSYATSGLKQWFVMIKDTKGRFTDDPLWGDGWGWALYMPGDKGKNVATNYKTDCQGCHLPAKADDWVYMEAYPTLSSE